MCRYRCFPLLEQIGHPAGCVSAERPIIEVEGLRKAYGETVALAGVDLEVRAGSVLGLLGPNGAGKTTLVRVLATLLIPDAGRRGSPASTSSRDPQDARRLLGLAGQYAAVDETADGAREPRDGRPAVRAAPQRGEAPRASRRSRASA